jgi:hypothetical protein
MAHTDPIQAYEAWKDPSTDPGREDECRAAAATLTGALCDVLPALRPDIWARMIDLAQDNPVNAPAYRLAAATVQAFEDAGLTDGTHFLGILGHVWGFTADEDYGVRLSG